MIVYPRQPRSLSLRRPQIGARLGTLRSGTALAAFLLACAVAFGLGWAAMQSPTSRLAVGTYGDWEWLSGFYRPERLDQDRFFRWSGGRATIRLPVSGDRGARILALTLDGGRAPELQVPIVRVVVDNQMVTFVAPSHPRRYELLARPRAAHSGLLANLSSDTFRPDGRPDDLGVRLHGVASRPLEQNMAWALFGWSIAFVLAATLAFSSMGRHAWAIGMVASGLALSLLLVERRDLAGGMLQVATALALLLAFGSYWLRARLAPDQMWTIGTLSMILLTGTLLRAYNLNWDDGAGFHVDEEVLNRASLALRPPYNPHFFAYGSLPIYLYRATAALLSLFDRSWLDPRVFPLVGRGYSALASTLTIALTAVIGMRLGGRRLGLIAALYLAFTVLAIQAAHFGTTDSLLTLLALALAYASLDLYQYGRRRDYVLCGVLIGLGIATKITALAASPLPVLAVLIRESAAGWPDRERLRASAVNIGLALLAAVAACLIVAPYYLLDAPSWLHAMRSEWSDATSGMADYTRQFIGTVPYLFLIQNWPWTLGWPLTVAILAGFVVTGIEIGRAWPSDTARQWAMLLGWAGCYFLFFGSVHDKYIRYTLPLTPILVLCAARLTLWVGGSAQRSWRQALLFGVVAGGTGLYALAFVNGVYGTPDSRLQASHWIKLNVEPGSTLTREQYEIRLPVPIRNDRSLGGLPWYTVESLQWYWDDSPEKAETIVQQLDSARYMVIASSTLHHPSLAHPELFPMNARFYRLVFDGWSGLREVARWQPRPRLGPWSARHTAPEHTFEIFDHPTVIIYERTAHYDPEWLKQYLWPEQTR